ncbi:MAG: nucleotide exchange factor GrpE, partial [Rhodospirillales bacterium]|nr:nucleotide exchange factor GrpE [Rhodospirillales bacterium]
APEGKEAEAEVGAQEEIKEETDQERIIRLEAEVEEQKDKILRTLAEAENVRRRAERDKTDIAKYAIANFAREMLNVADNLRRALDSVDENQRKENEAVETLCIGVEMTEKAMLSAFEQVGIKPVEALGKRFDHNLHQALFEIEDADKPAGTVIQEIQTGYVLDARLLRPSQVGISKGGPKETTEGNNGTEADAETPPVGKTGAYEHPGGEHGANLDEEL